MNYNPFDPIPRENQASGVKTYFMNEQFFTCSCPFYALEDRRNALRVISKNSKCDKFDAFVPYLAMNYFDRCISTGGYPHPGLMGDVLPISCLTLASKMKTKSFSIDAFLDARPDIRFREKEFGYRTVLSAELIILEMLEWRMHSITPFCFIDHYLQHFKSTKGFKRAGINEIIIQVQKDVMFTKFSSSIIAAAALLAASSFLYESDFEGLKDRLTSSEGVDLADLLACLEALISMCNNLDIKVECDELGPEKDPTRMEFELKWIQD